MKQALIEARKQADDQSLHDVYHNTHAIIFFGTPHRGSDLAGWARLLSTVAQAAQMDTNDAILIDLDPKSGSSKLEELRLDFDDVLNDDQRAQKLRVFSFQEEEGMTGVNLLGNKVSLRRAVWRRSFKEVQCVDLRCSRSPAFKNSTQPGLMSLTAGSRRLTDHF